MPTPPRDLSPLHGRHDLPLEPNRRTLLDTASFSQNDILELFSQATALEARYLADGSFGQPKRKRVLGLLFFEPSTRTRMSFEVAAHRLGYSTINLNSAASSLEKGETLSDTVLNVLAMGPDGLVVRYGVDAELDQLLPRLTVPVLSAGSGATAHPTQALLDALTIHRERGSVAGSKVLIVGDIRHSRVASSNFDVLTKLGAEIAICGPQQFLPEKDQMSAGVKIFEKLDEASSWCDVYMGLRVQLERHSDRSNLANYQTDYHAEFGLSPARLQRLKKNAIIMHPGPINHGVEFSSEVMADPRNRVLQQVTNGVLIRAALLARTFEEER